MVRIFFDEHAEQYCSNYFSKKQAGFAVQTRAAKALELLGTISGRVLDLGCGPGVMSSMVENKGCDVVGVDLSPGMLQLARRHAPKTAFCIGEGRSLPFASQTFDAGIAVGVLEFAEDERLVLRDMARMLRPGGVFVATFPNRRSPYALWRRKVYFRVLNLAHYLLGSILRSANYGVLLRRTYTESIVREWLRNAGLEPEIVEYANYQIVPSPLDGWIGSWAGPLATAIERLARPRFKRMAAEMVVRARRSS